MSWNVKFVAAACLGLVAVFLTQSAAEAGGLLARLRAKRQRCTPAAVCQPSPTCMDTTACIPTSSSRISSTTNDCCDAVFRCDREACIARHPRDGGLCYLCIEAAKWKRHACRAAERESDQIVVACDCSHCDDLSDYEKYGCQITCYYNCVCDGCNNCGPGDTRECCSICNGGGQ